MVESRPELAGSVLGSESEVRRSYLVFPAWSQPLWTWLTGKPVQHETPRWRMAPRVSLALTVLCLALLAAGQYALLTADAVGLRVLGWLLVLPASLVSAGLWRRIQVVFGHHAIHGTLVPGSEERNRRVARLLTLFSLSQSETEYERDHLDHHRRAVFTTLRDADANLLYRCGLRPGEPEGVLRHRLLKTLFSPRFHGWFLLVRLGSNLRRQAAWRGLALLWMALVFVGAPMVFGWLAALLILWLPLVVVYQMSALLQFTTEHVWLQSANGPSCMLSYADRCHGRFCGEATPGRDGASGGLLAWTGWWLRTLVLHLPTRLCVLVGDLPAHDWHHLCSILRQEPASWPSAIYERQRAIDSGHCAGMQQRELWGLDAMVTHVLRSLSQAAALPDESDLPAKPDPAGLRPSTQEP